MLKAWLKWLFAVLFMLTWTALDLLIGHSCEVLVVWVFVWWFGMLKFPKREEI